MLAQRLLIVAGVLAAGWCAAWPFRQGSSPAARPPAALPTELRAASRQEVSLQVQSSDQSPAAGLEESVATGPSTRVVIERRLTVENLTPPPPLPIVFQPNSEPAVASIWQPDRPAGGLATHRSARPRPYRLRDGDTLEKLAERFLGDKTRAIDIFRVNQNVLSTPDLLPVGTTITIPPRMDLGGG